MITALIYVAAGLLGSLVTGGVFVAGVLLGRLWDLVTGDNACDRKQEFIPRRRGRPASRGARRRGVSQPRAQRARV